MYVLKHFVGDVGLDNISNFTGQFYGKFLGSWSHNKTLKISL